MASHRAKTNTLFALEDNSVKNKSVKRHLLFAKKKEGGATARIHWLIYEEIVSAYHSF